MVSLRALSPDCAIRSYFSNEAPLIASTTPLTAHAIATPAKNLAGGAEMGYDLRADGRSDVKHPCLTARTRQVLAAICMVAHDDHGEFYMRGQKFVSEHFPDMSYSAYRNHLTALVKMGCYSKSSTAAGATVYGGGTTTRYRVNSPKVQNPHPAQGVQPDIVKSPEAQPSNPQVMENQPSASAAEVHQHVDELLAAGITNEQMVEILRAVRETMTGSGNLSDSEINLSGNEGNLSDSQLKHVRMTDRFR